MRRIGKNFVYKTENLTLRFLKKKDYQQWLVFLTDRKPAQNKWDDGPGNSEKLTKQQFFERVVGHESEADVDFEYRFYIFENKTGKMIGSTVLRHFIRTKMQNSGEVGYALSNNHWGKGYGFESAAATVEIAKKILNLRRVEAAINPKNKVSIGLIKKLGFVRIGLSIGHYCINGQNCDQVLFSKIIS